MIFSFRAYIIKFTPLLISLILISGNVFAQHADSLSSWVKVTANLEQYYVVVNEDFKNPHLINRGDSVQVNPGKSHITIVWRTVNDYSFFINAKPGETVVRNIIRVFPSYPRTSYQTIINQRNLQIISDPNSIIYINGERAGEHIVNTILKPGTHKLRIDHPEHGTLRKKVNVNNLAVTEIARFNENPSNLPFVAKLLPGAEYIASNRKGRAIITYVGLGLLTANLIKQNMSYTNKLDEYDKLVELYNTAQTTEDAIVYRRSAIQANEKLDEIGGNFNVTLILTGVFYALTTIDSIRKPRAGYTHSSGLFGPNVTLSTDVKNLNTPPLLSLKFTFD